MRFLENSWVDIGIVPRNPEVKIVRPPEGEALDFVFPVTGQRIYAAANVERVSVNNKRVSARFQDAKNGNC